MKSVILAIMLIAALPGSASPQSIGIFWATDASSWCVTQPQFSVGTMYVLALLGGAAAQGITGAEFRIAGFPASWVTSTQASVACGIACDPGPCPDPFGAGTALYFPTCCLGTNCIVLLFTVSYFATTTEINRLVNVQARTPPSDPNLPCPVMRLCDAPTYTGICVQGGQGLINRT